MNREFKTGCRYEFDKELYLEYLRTAETPDIAKERYLHSFSWVNLCDGKEVAVVSNIDGLIGKYEITPEWCRCIQDNRDVPMKLWEVTNGYIGESYVRCFVTAKDEDSAVAQARLRFKGESAIYGSNYYSNITAECICEDVSQEWCSSVWD